jgi:hypothetical protein
LSTALPLYSLPAIGEVWPGQGGVFAGLYRDADGNTCALIDSGQRVDSGLTHAKAVKWANGVEAEGHSDFALASKTQIRLLQAHRGDSFGDMRWCWLLETQGSAFAWYCFLVSGIVFYGYRSHEGGAVAVRSFILQPFNPSGAAA